MGQDETLQVRHNLNPKATRSGIGMEERDRRLDEMIESYQQLHHLAINVQEDSGGKTISIPFINTIESVWK
jgi:hypothetical protein